MGLKNALKSKRTRWIVAAIVVLLGAGAWYWFSRDEGQRAIYAEVQEGSFTVSVKVTGELEAVHSETIDVPCRQDAVALA